MFNTKIKLEKDPKKVYELMDKLHQYYDVMRTVESIKDADKKELLCYNMMGDADTILKDLAEEFNNAIIKYVEGE